MKRGVPAIGSMPTVASARPKAAQARPFTSEPPDSAATELRPNTPTAKYPAGPNFNASEASGMASSSSASPPRTPPTVEAVSEIEIASFALPCRAME